MIPGCFDWPEQYAGDTAKVLEFTLSEDGTAISLAGATIRMQVRKRPNSPPVIELNSVGADGIEITDGPNGVFEVGGHLNPDINACCSYDMEFTFPSGEVKTYIAGSYPIYGQVTK